MRLILAVLAINKLPYFDCKQQIPKLWMLTSLKNEEPNLFQTSKASSL